MGQLLELRTQTPRLRYNYSEVVALLPDEYRKKVTADEGKNRSIGHDLLLWCVTQSTHFLDHTSANVLQFIIARTYGYAKEGELISINHFITGVFAVKDGRSIIAPAVKDRATVYKALAVLEAAGLVERTRVTINSADVVSVVCVKAQAVLALTMTEEKAKMLRESRKQKQPSTIEIDEEEGEFVLKTAPSRVGGFPTTRVGEKPTTEYINKEDIKHLSCSGLRNAKRITRKRTFEIDCKDTAQDAISKAIARVTEKREAKVRRAAAPGKGFISLSEINATWQQAMVSIYGSCTVSGLTHREYGVFKRMAKPHVLSASWLTFFEWVIRNWGAINKESQEIARYRKEKTGDWSMADDHKIFLGTDKPDIYHMTRNYVKLIKRFSQNSMANIAVTVQDSEEMERLRKDAAQARREAAMNRQLLQRALAAPVTAATTEPRRKVTIVNPSESDFTEDASLPEWR